MQLLAKKWLVHRQQTTRCEIQFICRPAVVAVSKKVNSDLHETTCGQRLSKGYETTSYIIIKSISAGFFSTSYYIQAKRNSKSYSSTEAQRYQFFR
jgi:hypothetical protein